MPRSSKEIPCSVKDIIVVVAASIGCRPARWPRLFELRSTGMKMNNNKLEHLSRTAQVSPQRGSQIGSLFLTSIGSGMNDDGQQRRERKKNNTRPPTSFSLVAVLRQASRREIIIPFHNDNKRDLAQLAKHDRSCAQQYIIVRIKINSKDDTFPHGIKQRWGNNITLPVGVDRKNKKKIRTDLKPRD